jgi:hypothetical protein
LGSRLEAIARILPAHEQHVAQQLMDRKYGWQKRFFELIWRLQRREQLYLEITPRRD